MTESSLSPSCASPLSRGWARKVGAGYTKKRAVRRYSEEVVDARGPPAGLWVRDSLLQETCAMERHEEGSEADEEDRWLSWSPPGERLALGNEEHSSGSGVAFMGGVRFGVDDGVQRHGRHCAMKRGCTKKWQRKTRKWPRKRASDVVVDTRGPPAGPGVHGSLQQQPRAMERHEEGLEEDEEAQRLSWSPPAERLALEDEEHFCGPSVVFMGSGRGGVDDGVPRHGRHCPEPDGFVAQQRCTAVQLYVEARYGLVCMAKINRLWTAASYHMKESDVARLLGHLDREGQFAVVQDYAMWAFSGTIHWSLQTEYATPGAGMLAEKDTDVEALLAAEIRYPNQPVVTLGDLLRSRHACYRFLRDLYGNGRRPFFYAYGIPMRHSVVRGFRDVCWALVLPYALVRPLVAKAVDQGHRFDRDGHRYTKYGLDVPVKLGAGAWYSLRELLRAAGRGTAKLPDESAFSDGIVTFASNDCSAVPRCVRVQEGGAALANGFVALEKLPELAHAKELWWYEAMRAEFGG